MLVTVRQILSAGPAPGKPGRLSGTSAVSPFSDGGSLALPTGTDESRASISAIQFSCSSIAPQIFPVNRFFAFAKKFSRISENPSAAPRKSVRNGGGNYWKPRSVPTAAERWLPGKCMHNFLRFSALHGTLLGRKNNGRPRCLLCAAQFNTRSRLSHEQDHR